MINSKITASVVVLGGILVTACVSNPAMPTPEEQNLSRLTVSQVQQNEQIPLTAVLLPADSLPVMQPAVNDDSGIVASEQAEIGSVTGELSSQEQNHQGEKPAGYPALDSPLRVNEPVVLWGGTIASVTNQSDGSTVVEIVSRPLRKGGRPIHDDRSDGRFLAHINDFLDPEIIKKGRDMTVVGRLTQRFSGAVGESSYVFPVVGVEKYRYWRRVVTVPQRSGYNYSQWNNFYPFSYYDPFWGRWPNGRLPPSRHPHPHAAP